MSWHVLSDGRIDDRHGDAPIAAADIAAVDFDQVGGYRPTIGGRRHLTDLPSRPPERTVVRLLCGDTYEVGSRAKSKPVDGCPTCAEVHVERQRAR